MKIFNQELVSVLIPCYNHGMYIDQTVESVLIQTHKLVEIIIVDAGSDDSFTIKKLLNYSRPFTKVIYSKKRMYPSEARNFAFLFSHGNFILTLDADDLIEKTFIEKCLKEFKNDTVAAVSSKVLYFGYEEGFLDYKGGYIEDVIYRMGSHLCAVIRRESWLAINGFDNDIVDGFEDWEFWIRITKKNWSIFIIPEILIYYRQKEVSRVTELFAIQNQVIDSIRSKHLDLYKNPFKFINEVIKT